MPNIVHKMRVVMRPVFPVCATTIIMTISNDNTQKMAFYAVLWNNVSLDACWKSPPSTDDFFSLENYGTLILLEYSVSAQFTGAELSALHKQSVESLNYTLGGNIISWHSAVTEKDISCSKWVGQSRITPPLMITARMDLPMKRSADIKAQRAWNDIKCEPIAIGLNGAGVGIVRCQV